VRLAIDDFDTGYSSLAYPKRLPIHELEIDRGFVRNRPLAQNDAEIAATIIAMARNLNLSVIAEEIETHEQWDFLNDRNYPVCQGYLVGRPMPADEFLQAIRSESVCGQSGPG
jgi:EAL domain-containing protein (putative c-di-GMP-specific phosphodiesterase class I)